MLPEPGSPEDRLRYARSDLVVAQQFRAEGVLLETLCFHAQQAAEKGIKAVLVSFGIAFPKIHSIARLVDLLPQSVSKTTELRAADQLAFYAIELRYPGRQESVSEEEYREAVRLAEVVVAWAEDTIGAAPADRA